MQWADAVKGSVEGIGTWFPHDIESRIIVKQPANVSGAEFHAGNCFSLPASIHNQTNVCNAADTSITAADCIEWGMVGKWVRGVRTCLDNLVNRSISVLFRLFRKHGCQLRDIEWDLQSRKPTSCLLLVTATGKLSNWGLICHSWTHPEQRKRTKGHSKYNTKVTEVTHVILLDKHLHSNTSVWV